MMDTAYGPTARDLMRIAREHGFRVTEHQLERWRGAGLLPRPQERPGQGYGRGRVGIYPAGTEKQLLALLDLRKRDRRLEKIGWGLFQQGFPLKEFRRHQLQNWLTRLENEIAGDADEEGTSKLFVDWARDGAVPAWAGEIRTALGRKDFAVLAKIFADVALGEFHERRWYDEDELRVITKVYALFFDLDPAECNAADIIPILKTLSEHLRLEKVINHIGGNTDPATQQVLQELGWAGLILILIYAFKKPVPDDAAKQAGRSSE